VNSFGGLAGMAAGIGLRSRSVERARLEAARASRIQKPVLAGYVIHVAVRSGRERDGDVRSIVSARQRAARQHL